MPYHPRLLRPPSGEIPRTGTRMSIDKEVSRRRTFAIISHPDAGKTTLTEKLLLYAGAIHIAGSVKSRKASRYATWSVVRNGLTTFLALAMVAGGRDTGGPGHIRSNSNGP